MVHQRSKTKERQRRKKYRDWFHFKEEVFDKPNGIVLRYSHKDLQNGEVIWTFQTKSLIYEKLKEYFGDKGIPDFFTNHEFGDVLNRFPIIPVRAEGLAI